MTAQRQWKTSSLVSFYIFVSTNLLQVTHSLGMGGGDPPPIPTSQVESMAREVQTIFPHMPIDVIVADLQVWLPLYGRSLWCWVRHTSLDEKGMIDLNSYNYKRISNVLQWLFSAAKYDDRYRQSSQLNR